MNAKPPITKAPALPKQSRFPMKILAIVLFLTLGLMGLFLFLTSGSGSEVVWLSPGQLAKSGRPGPITQIKYKLARYGAPFWRRIRPNRKQILVSSSVVRLPVQGEDASWLPAALSTNSDGTRIWIISPVELARLQARLIPMMGQLPPAGPRIATSEGIRAQLFTGGVPPNGTNAGSPSIAIDVLPRLVGGLIKLTLGITSTEFLVAPENAVRNVRTNICAACRVLVPNGGGLVLSAGQTNNEVVGSYWVILIPAVVDAQGKPLKL
jgi:hypothetical protein